MTHLAVGENVAASTQNQALATVLSLYQHVLERPLDRIEGVVRARKSKRLPVVLTRDEVQAILAQLDGAPSLVCTLLYGSGLRLLEGDVQTTVVYTHVLNRGGRAVSSPLDGLRKAVSGESGGIIRPDRSA